MEMTAFYSLETSNGTWSSHAEIHQPTFSEYFKTIQFLSPEHWFRRFNTCVQKRNFQKQENDPCCFRRVLLNMLNKKKMIVKNFSSAHFGYTKTASFETVKEELDRKEWDRLNISFSIWSSKISIWEGHKNYRFYTSQSGKIKKRKSFY